MSGKSVKLNKRIAKRYSNRLFKQGMAYTMEFAYGCNFHNRLKIAFSILFKTK